MKTVLILLLTACSFIAAAQEMPASLNEAIKTDDATKLVALVTKDNINNCYTEKGWGYSLLAQTIRANAKKCFDYLIAQGADANRACDGYVPPLMHAAKYGRLEMVKILVAKGAKTDYQYNGDYELADGETPLTYAQKNNQAEVAAYLQSLKTKN